jgi:hypothetical protein
MQLPRDVKTTSAKRNLELDGVAENARKKAKKSDKETKDRAKVATQEARKATEQGGVCVQTRLGFLR